MSINTLEEYANVTEELGEPIGRLLHNASKLLASRTVTRFNEQSKQVSLNLSEFNVLQFLCFKGLNAKEIAKRLNISKQAVAQTIIDLENKKLIKRTKDPEDSRSKIIVHTKKGLKIISELLEITTSIEYDLRNEFGAKKYSDFKKFLKTLSQ